MTSPRFDLHALFEAINTERSRCSLSWAALGREIGVAPSTIRRFASAADAEADGVLATLQWLGAIPERFIVGGNGTGARLPPASQGHARVDMQMITEAIDDPRGANGRTRTTIQTLTSASRRSGQPIANLTRLTDY